MKILVLNGPNINMLGIREPETYGKGTYKDLLNLLKAAAAERHIDISFYQSNHEGDLVDAIQDAYQKIDGIIFNPAAYTHTSIALLDALKAVSIPTVEVHISDVSNREDFRQQSFIRAACLDTISGRGFSGYVDALDLLVDHVKKRK